jgi:hypothetical protein
MVQQQQQSGIKLYFLWPVRHLLRLRIAINE